MLLVNAVDPRNNLYLIPKLLADVIRYRPPLLEALRALFMVFGVPAVIANGRVVYSGDIPEAGEAVATLRHRYLAS